MSFPISPNKAAFCKLNFPKKQSVLRQKYITQKRTNIVHICFAFYSRQMSNKCYSLKTIILGTALIRSPYIKCD